MLGALSATSSRLPSSASGRWEPRELLGQGVRAGAEGEGGSEPFLSSY